MLSCVGFEIEIVATEVITDYRLPKTIFIYVCVYINVRKSPN